MKDNCTYVSTDHRRQRSSIPDKFLIFVRKKNIYSFLFCIPTQKINNLKPVPSYSKKGKNFLDKKKLNTTCKLSRHIQIIISKISAFFNVLHLSSRFLNVF